MNIKNCPFWGSIKQLKNIFASQSFQTIACKIKHSFPLLQVEQATGLTSSAGIASNGMLAKICSDLRKPNGQFRLESNREAVVSFMRDLPIRKVSPKTKANKFYNLKQL
jgi:hypothetical protein